MNQERKCEMCGSQHKVRKLDNRDDVLCLKCRAENVVTLDEVRELYTRNQKHANSSVTRPDFDTLLARFRLDCESFTDIAHDLEITGERVRQLYLKYFSRLIPRRPDGMTRRIMCARRTHAQQTRESFEQTPRYATLLEKARENGLVATPIRTGKIKASVQLFKLGGRVCKLLVCKKPYKFGRTTIFWRIIPTFQTKQFEFLIMQAGVGSDAQFIVLPASIVKTRRTIYIPLNFRWSGYNNSKPKIDWLLYLGAWHLLKAKVAVSATR